ncbi:MAG: arginine repressor [Oscillospiraceae bacterium]|nr:arginine repressor [Oscillospiraceae bacterium]MBQ2791752.1 arginine repressor [Oscillospiraceae bacterium]MBQ3242500.1 arginine repressor [Oscillospiraceae bacterium]MBR2635629.1 arginine repressor [Oscillospiraceae bacterium]MBR6607825.1 arginine repressor [Oscillospiraceae bacterium]
MKTKRHQKILELIANHVVDTQEELLRLLRQSGFEVTQATVSRDIKELQLVKTASSDGKYRYSANAKKPRRDMTDQFYTFLAKSVDDVDYCRNFVVVKCHTGMANAVCELLDNMHVEGIVGTLSGDNTFFVMMREDEQAARLAKELTNHIGGR